MRPVIAFSHLFQCKPADGIGAGLVAQCSYNVVLLLLYSTNLYCTSDYRHAALIVLLTLQLQRHKYVFTHKILRCLCLVRYL